ncbi:dihydrofolate reductase [Chelativorans sp. ZYF759]|uniref:dihydrofolate reductase n=1 Tax=Chelativorans sp. ZYF759 TaxID=2692213 RepID=UPI0034D5CAAF
MDVEIYVAVARNGVIGNDGDMPWRLSTDLKRFKAGTMGKPVIMGRKTWESIGKPLPGRRNIVVTRNRDYTAQGAQTVPSLDAALAIAKTEGAEAAAIIGGGEIYRMAMDAADMLHVTHVEAELEGDTHFPAIDPAVWQPVSREAVAAGERDSFATEYVVYTRLKA